MRSLSAEEVLRVWERGLEQLPLQRALVLLEAACPESTPQGLASMSIGRRDASLLQLRELAFGSRMTGCAVCQSCGESLEIDLLVSDLLQLAGDAEPGVLALAAAGHEFTFRNVNSLDLAACRGASPEQMRRLLFARCLLTAQTEGREIPAEQVPEEVVQTAVEEAVKADPQANLEIVVACVACGNRGIEVFDVVFFLWNEIDVWARRVLRDVHALASAYGWRESDILELTPLRRQFYLEMAGA